MKNVVGVRFKNADKIYHFDPGELELTRGDMVVVETSRGNEIGTVAAPVDFRPEGKQTAPLKKVVRKADDKDILKDTQNREKEAEAFSTCEQRIESHKLDMKLVNVEYAFDGSKIVFYFTADGRVDFRELVKDLASVFKTRIELRQIGVRDEAKMLGGLGMCGRETCCGSYLNEFQPVSIKMAKEQNMSLSPTKISGLCGRLMCCLKYEQDYYEEMKKKMPKVGKEVETPDGCGICMENQMISCKCRVRVTLPDGTPDVRTYPLEDIVINPQPKPVDKDGQQNTKQQANGKQKHEVQNGQQSQKQNSGRPNRPDKPPQRQNGRKQQGAQRKNNPTNPNKN